MQALAGHIGCNVCVLDLGSKNMNDATLADLLSTLPVRSIILLEDVDAIFVNRDAASDQSNCVTFSGLLNAIDGVTAPEGSVLFMV